jgi:3-dehydroquinate synthase
MKKLSCRVVRTSHSKIVTGNDWHVLLEKELKSRIGRKASILIILDSNTSRHCLPILIERINALVYVPIFTLNPGEWEKSIEKAAVIWASLAEAGADRETLIINLGGGVVTDIGGFVASTYARGINFINIPTTLMGMADAAIGGKNAVNVAGIKNKAGTFSFPKTIYIIPEFLETLDKSHLLSGFAEIVKSALVADAARWKVLKKLDLGQILASPFDLKFWSDNAFSAIAVKNAIVKIDPFERKERKLLNFGHTIGHAFEALNMDAEQPLTHGKAIAMGMICEAWLSHMAAGLPASDLEEISGWIIRNFGHLPVATGDTRELFRLLSHDKKNIAGTYRFTLLSAPGKGVINVRCSQDLVKGSLDYYQSLDEG